MSQNSTQLIAFFSAVAAGGITFLLTSNGGAAAVVGAAAGGVVLFFQGNNALQQEAVVATKKPKGVKGPKKSPPSSSPPEQSTENVTKSSKKKSKKSESTTNSTPKSPQQKEQKEQKEQKDQKPPQDHKSLQQSKSPAAKPAAKSPTPQPQPKSKAPPQSSVVEDDAPKELTKTQLAKIKKREKKAEEEKQKTDEKALSEKKETQAKKTAKAAQKKKAANPPPVPVQSDKSDEDEQQEKEQQEEVLEPGWEKPKPRNTVRIRSPQEEKKRQQQLLAKAKSPIIQPEREQKTTEVVNIAKNKHGLIIGQKRAMLDQIIERTGADIKMPKREGGGLGIVITGTNAQVNLAKQVVTDLANRGFSEVTHPGLAGNQIEVKDGKEVGRIAGKDGKFLKEIQNRSGAKVQLPDKNAQRQVISIVGKPDEVNKAKEYINCLLTLGYCEATHPGWITEEVEFKPDNLGRLIGFEGKTISELSQSCKVKIDTPKKNDPNAPQDVIFIKGKPDNIAAVKQKIEELLASSSNADVVDEMPVPDPNDPWQIVPEAEDF